MAWRVAKSLLKFHAQLKTEVPAAAPPATPANAWGTIGDEDHSNTSDHSPHDFPGWGNEIVTAADIPHAPALGLNARAVLDHIRLSHDNRVKYGISQGQMFSSYAAGNYPPWTWRPYTGSDGHFDHGHLSVVGDPRADGEQPWATGYTPAGGFVALSGDDEQALIYRVDALRKQANAIEGGPTAGEPNALAVITKKIDTQTTGLGGQLSTLAGLVNTLTTKVNDLAAAVAALPAPVGGLPFTAAQELQIENAAFRGANRAEDV